MQLEKWAENVNDSCHDASSTHTNADEDNFKFDVFTDPCRGRASQIQERDIVIERLEESREFENPLPIVSSGNLRTNGGAGHIECAPGILRGRKSYMLSSPIPLHRHNGLRCLSPEHRRLFLFRLAS